MDKSDIDVIEISFNPARKSRHSFFLENLEKTFQKKKRKIVSRSSAKFSPEKGYYYDAGALTPNKPKVENYDYDDD